MIWVNKYSPKTMKEVKGNNFSIDELIDFIKNFESRRKKGVILAGPTGTGKTASVYAFAKENDYEILELNASDVRNKSNIEEFMNSAMNQMSLFMKPKIILIDEIDGLSGVKDRGGAQALSKLIEKSSFPIVMTANDITLDKLSSLVKKTEVIDFNGLTSSEINERLNEILSLENLEGEDFIVKSIASRSGGDLRAAINDLQTLYSKGTASRDDLELIGDRKREEELNNVLRLIFKSKDINLIEQSLDDINLDELQSWVQKNVVLEYDSQDFGKAFNSLSLANVFKGRIMRWQYWRFLVYQKFFMSSGVALSKEKKSSKIIKYKRPNIGLMVWQSNMRNAKRKSISGKLAKYYNVSYKKAFKDIFPSIIPLIKNPNVQEKLGLEEDEINWINEKLLCESQFS
jgi:replication factor C large subunit